jgi:pimeloyl-ACP methyl ester carboxylesterase
MAGAARPPGRRPLAARRGGRRAGPPTRLNAPARFVTSGDGTPIAVFSSGSGPPLLLLHGAAADHTTFRVVGPLLAERYTVHELDRRGRGASGDAPDWSIEREYEDVAAVAAAVASDPGVDEDADDGVDQVDAVDVVGHSLGGRIALGAAMLTERIRRVVVYEGAPPAPERPYQDPGLVARLRSLDRAGEHDRLFETFLRAVVGMSDVEVAAYRANPVWPARVAAAPTIVRELEAEASPAASLAALGLVRQPVLQLLGGASLPSFGDALAALDARLANGRVVVIDGAKHAAHHTHPDAFVGAVAAFLSEP